MILQVISLTLTRLDPLRVRSIEKIKVGRSNQSLKLRLPSEFACSRHWCSVYKRRLAGVKTFLTCSTNFNHNKLKGWIYLRSETVLIKCTYLGLKTRVPQQWMVKLMLGTRTAAAAAAHFSASLSGWLAKTCYIGKPLSKPLDNPLWINIASISYSVVSGQREKSLNLFSPIGSVQGHLNRPLYVLDNPFVKDSISYSGSGQASEKKFKLFFSLGRARAKGEKNKKV